MEGVVAAGHPLTAEAGAEGLEAGGNAVDAAVACVLTSFVAESALTGPGAGGFMLLHTGGESHLLDFFVAVPGKGIDAPRPAALVPIDVTFAEGAVQRFNVGPSSCGAPGTTRGLDQALRRFGTLSLAELCERPARAAREGVEVTPMQGFLFRVLEPIFRSTPEATAIYAPEGRLLREGETIRLPELGDLLERLGREGPEFIYTGDVGKALSDWVLEGGGLLTAEDLASYEVIKRAPVGARYHGREILTNPPPSSGGILIAYALDLLERLGRPRSVRALVEVMDRANRARTREFNIGLQTEGYLERFLAKDALESAAHEVSGRLGSTTHVSVMDGQGRCVAVTCSNGSCSGVVVPGTGVHLNNMLGEEDLNPLGYHLHTPGAGRPLRGRRGRGRAGDRPGRARRPRARRLADRSLDRAQPLLRRGPGRGPRLADRRPERRGGSAPGGGGGVGRLSAPLPTARTRRFDGPHGSVGGPRVGATTVGPCPCVRPCLTSGRTGPSAPCGSCRPSL